MGRREGAEGEVSCLFFQFCTVLSHFLLKSHYNPVGRREDLSDLFLINIPVEAGRKPLDHPFHWPTMTGSRAA